MPVSAHSIEKCRRELVRTELGAFRVVVDPKHTKKQSVLQPFLMVFVLEGGLVLVMSLVAYSLFAWPKALAVCLGGWLFVVPNTYFTLYAFRYRGAAWARWVARAFYQGLMGKLLLSAIGFALIFRFFPDVHAVTLFGSYCGVMCAHVWLAKRISDGLQASTVPDTV